jgi:hypothetical protein
VACGHGMLGWKAVGYLGLRGVMHEGKVPLGQAQSKPGKVSHRLVRLAAGDRGRRGTPPLH